MDASSDLLWQCRPVITNIFKYLCARDLSSCAKVCSLWNSLSITENNRRRFVEWFLEINAGQTINMEHHFVDRTPHVGTLYSFQQQLASMRVHPSICLAFVTLDTLLPISRSQSYRKRMQNRMNERRLKEISDIYLSPFLPVQCQLHCMPALAIVGCHSNGSPAKIEEGISGISGLLLPNFPGVYVHCFSFQIYEQWLSYELPDCPIKGLLMFMSRDEEGFTLGYIEHCVNHNKGEKFAIGGTIVPPEVKSFPPSNRGIPDLDGLNTCFLFTGENVEVASVVIDRPTMDVGYELALFKKTGMLENQCFAFMFSLVDRRLQFYVRDFETSHFEMFRTMYPHVPLTAVFGAQQIGNQFLPNVGKDDPDYKQFAINYCVRMSSTIFVLISVKTPK